MKQLAWCLRASSGELTTLLSVEVASQVADNLIVALGRELSKTQALVEEAIQACLLPGASTFFNPCALRCHAWLASRIVQSMQGCLIERGTPPPPPPRPPHSLLTAHK